MSAIVFLIIGAVSGCLAGIVLQGGRLALLGNIIIGIIGSVAGGFLFGSLGLSADGLIGSVFTATIGGMILLFGVRVIK